MNKVIREAVKTLIECSTEAKQADDIIVQYYGFKTVQEKIAFLKGIFDVEVVGHEHETTQTDYECMLNAVVNRKWM